MNPYELWEKQFQWGTGTYGPSGLEWLEKFRAQYPHMIWLNPEPMPAQPAFWSQTHWYLAKLIKMYDLSAEGLEQGLRQLMARR